MENISPLFSYGVYICYAATLVLLAWMIWKKRMLDGWWLSLFSLCATIVAVDILLIALQFDPYVIKIRKIYDAEIGARNTPNLHMPIEYSAENTGDLLNIYHIDNKNLATLPENETYSFNYQIDKNGFRNTTALNPADIDILTIGDSFTIASSLPLEKTWSTVLGEKTKRKSYQAAVNQIGPKNYLKILQLFAPKLTPKTEVVIGFFEGNDLHDLYFSAPSHTVKNLALLLQYTKEQLQQKAPQTQKISIPTIQIAGTDWPVLFYKEYVDQLLKTRKEIISSENFEKLEKIFSDIAKTCQAYQLSCHIAYFPTKFHVYYPQIRENFNYGQYFNIILPGGDYTSPPQSNFDENIDNEEDMVHLIVKKAGINFISLTNALRQESNKNIIFWPYDTHINSLGNQIAAETIAEEIHSPLLK